MANFGFEWFYLIVINLGTTNLTMKQSFGTDYKSVPCFVNKTTFTGATDIFRKTFVSTQKEIAAVFENDKAADGVAGNLPKNWISKINAKTEEEKNQIIKKVLLAFRAAIKHLKPYNAPEQSKEYSIRKVQLENKRVKEASHFLTKALRHFGILSETGSVNSKRRKVHGAYINRGYVLREKSENPTLEKLFIKTFKKYNKEIIEANYNGTYSETAHGLNINELNCKYISKIYWGDVKGNYMATEYETPPKYSSPIVQFKKTYKTLQDFAKDFKSQTGLDITELIERGIRPGRTDWKGEFAPYDKCHIIMSYLQSELKKVGLYHGDLHKDNAIIGTDNNGKAIVKIIDIGGVMKR